MKRLLGLALAAVLITGVMPASAESYQSYTYNAYDEPVYAPDMYITSEVYNGGSLGIGDLNQPTDLICGKDGFLYLTDSKNNRIVKISDELKTEKVFDSFKQGENTLTLSSPTNVFVTGDGTLYISDNGNRRVIICDAAGNVEKVLEKPESELFPQEKEFLPMDLVVTSTGVLYVLCDGIYQGAVVFDENNEFSGFYGSNTVEASFKVIADYFWKKIATKEQRSKMSRYVPVQYSALAIDSEDFVYAAVSATDDPSARIRKLNPLGNNILTGTDGRTLSFGDSSSYTYGGATYSTAFESVTVGDTMFAALDRTDGKVFVYSQDGDLLSVFGSTGNYKGCFTDAVAVTFLGDSLLVLDAKKGDITRFEMTDYGVVLLKALEVYTDGRYEESLELWQEVLKYSSSSYLANLGYGKALYQIGEYREAMECFEQANDKQRYSEAYKMYRNNIIRENFVWFAAGAVLIIILLAVCIKLSLFSKAFYFIKGKIKLGKERKQV